MVSELRIDEIPSQFVVVEDDRIRETPDLMRIGRVAGVVCLRRLFPDTRSWADTNVWSWTTPYVYGRAIQSSIMANLRVCPASRHGNEIYVDSGTRTFC